MPELDTNPPAWLQRNWAPRESFDPSPWLKQAYDRQIQQEKLPLELQGMALRNQAAQLVITHQGRSNDLLAKEQPELAKWITDQIGRPMAETLNDPGPGLLHPDMVQALNSYKAHIAQTTYGLATRQALIKQTQQASEVADILGIVVPRNEDGTFDQAQLADLSQQANEAKMVAAQRARLEQIQTQTGWHTNAMGGIGSADATEKQALAMQRARQRISDAYATGDEDAIMEAETFYNDLRLAQQRQHRDPVDSTELQLIRQSIVQLDKQLGDITLKSKWPELEKKRGELIKQLHDFKVSGSGLSNNTADITKPGKTQNGEVPRLGSIVEQGGKRYRYQGGDVNDPGSYIEVK